MTATEFKAKCLELLDRVAGTGEVVRVTKRGKVVAELRPALQKRPNHAKAGFAKKEIRIFGDIVEPLGVEWEAMK